MTKTKHKTAPDLQPEQAALQKLERRMIGLAAAIAALPAAALAHDDKTGGAKAAELLESLKPDLVALAEKTGEIHAALQVHALQIGAILQTSGGDDKEPPREMVLRALGLS